MATLQVSAKITVERDGSELELTVEGRFSPGIPGRLSGPPEDCYPDEPAEAEVESVYLNGQPWAGKLTPEEEETATEALMAAGEDFDGGHPDPDDYYDSRFDREEDY